MLSSNIFSLIFIRTFTSLFNGKERSFSSDQKHEDRKLVFCWNLIFNYFNTDNRNKSKNRFNMVKLFLNEINSLCSLLRNIFLYQNPCPYQKFVPSMGKGTGNINTQRTVGLLKEAVNQWKGFIQYLFFTKVGNMLTLAIYLCLQRRRLLFYYNHFKLRLSYLFYILQMYLIRRLKSLYVWKIQSITKSHLFLK